MVPVPVHGTYMDNGKLFTGALLFFLKSASSYPFGITTGAIPCVYIESFCHGFSDHHHPVGFVKHCFFLGFMLPIGTSGQSELIVDNRFLSRDPGNRQSREILDYCFSFRAIRCMLWGGPVEMIASTGFSCRYFRRNLTDGLIQYLRASGIKRFPLIQTEIPSFFARLFIFTQESGIDAVPGTLPDKPLVQLIGFPDAPLYHNGFRLYIIQKGGIIHRGLRVFRGIYDRLPAKFGEVLGEFQPSLNTRSSTGRPVIGYDQDPFHHEVFLELLQQVADIHLLFDVLFKEAVISTRSCSMVSL